MYAFLLVFIGFELRVDSALRKFSIEPQRSLVQTQLDSYPKGHFAHESDFTGVRRTEQDGMKVVVVLTRLPIHVERVRCAQ